MDIECRGDRDAIWCRPHYRSSSIIVYPRVGSSDIGACYDSSETIARVGSRESREVGRLDQVSGLVVSCSRLVRLSCSLEGHTNRFPKCIYLYHLAFAQIPAPAICMNDRRDTTIC